MQSSHRPAGRTAGGAPWRRIFTGFTAGAVGVLGLVAVPGAAQAASTTPAAAWPSTWKSYGFTDGTDVMDDNGDVFPARDDLVSGNPQRTAPTAQYASDGTNAFLRMRVAGSNADASKGGLFGDIFIVDIADANGVLKGTIGVDGNSGTTDYVHVTTADGSVVKHVYDYPTSGFRWIPAGDGSGQYFLDLQVPFTAISAVWPGFTGGTPVKLFYGSSTANAPGNINKDYMTGSVIDFTGLRPIKFVPGTYTVTFDANGGTAAGSTSASVSEGDKVAAPGTPTRQGYAFDGWWTAPDGGSRWSFSTGLVTGTTTLYAHWKANTYSVTFDADGGTGVDPRTVEYGKLLTEPADPSKTGYTFVGWFDAAAAPATEWDFARDTVTADTRLVAHWNVNTHTVSFAGTGDSTVPSKQVAFGQKVDAPADPTREGYTFTGWYDGAGQPWNFAEATVGDADVTLTAHWSVNPVTITFDTDGGSTNPDNASIKPGDLLTAPAEPTKTGYTFGGWYDASTGKLWDFATDTVTGATDLVAHWVIKSYTVTIGGQPQTVEHGTLLTEPAAPTRTGYTFVGWFDQATGNKWDFAHDAVTADTQLVPRWNINTHTVTFAGTADATTPTKQVDFGQKIDAPADPTREGYTFTGWYDGTADQPWDFAEDTIGDADVTLTAHWEIKSYTVTIGGEPQTVDYGQHLTEPADPTRTGYTFVGWFDQATGNKWEFDRDTVTADTQLVPHWAINTYTVTIGDGEPQTVEYGQHLTEPADPTKPGHDFVGWFDESTHPATEWDFDRDTVTADTQLVAHWSIQSYTIAFDTDGGSDNPTSDPVNFGDKITEPAAPTRDGYTFAGWYDGTTKWDFANDTVTHATTLVAHWTAVPVNSCTVTFDAAGGSAVDAIRMPCGQVATAPAAPTKHGYTFTGWATGDGTAYSFGSAVDHDLTLVAQWVAADSDGDGLTDPQEEELGTNPNSADSDRDGIKDSDEVTGALNTYGHCPTSPVVADTDHDGLNDGREIRGIWMKVRVVTGKKARHRIGLVKPNPCSADTDRDGIRDRREIRGVKVKKRHATFRTSPVLKDTDRDGLTDKQEETGSANKKFHRTPSNPLNWDTDHGGVSDGAEVKAGSNPSDVHSSPVKPRIVVPLS